MRINFGVARQKAEHVRLGAFDSQVGSESGRSKSKQKDG